LNKQFHHEFQVISGVTVFSINQANSLAKK
jgi:hypothetical protein